MKKKCFISVLSVFACFTAFSQWICGDSLIDNRDGKVYPTVQIGNQCWMAKNIDIGVMLTAGSFPSNNSIIEKFCYNNEPDSCLIHGGMYSWDEMMNYTTQEGTQGICPPGWYIPSDDEMKEMERALGMDSLVAELANQWRGTDQGTQMKIGGISGLDFPLSGLVALSQSFMFINSNAYFYTSTESGTNAWRRCLSISSPLVGRYNTFPKSYAFSVRCIKGPDTTTVRIPAMPFVPVLFYVYENQELVIGYVLNENAQVLLNVFDVSGRKVFSRDAMFEKEIENFSVQLPFLSNGIYIVTISSEKFHHAGKILIR
jgi:uncharacterized protein (TIGR02145 family)